MVFLDTNSFFIARQTFDKGENVSLYIVSCLHIPLSIRGSHGCMFKSAMSPNKIIKDQNKHQAPTSQRKFHSWEI